MLIRFAAHLHDAAWWAQARSLHAIVKNVTYSVRHLSVKAKSLHSVYMYGFIIMMIRKTDAAARSVNTEHSMRSKNRISEKSTRLYQRHQRIDRQTDGHLLGDKPDAHKA